MSSQQRKAETLPPIRIPWARPPVGAAEAEAAREAIADTALSMGRRAQAFEAGMASYAGRSHALAVSNGTDALEVAFRLVGLKAGDEVLVSSLSYIATVICIVRIGAIPVFCDVVPESLNIDPESIAENITGRTRAIIVADYCGFSVDYGRIEPICRAHGLQLIVDGAQSIGTFFDGRSALGYGTVATTSFHSAKIMTTGEGGMVFFDDHTMLEPALRMRGQGEIPGRKYIHDTLGFNHRLTDFQAAIGLVQLEKLPALCAARARLAARYYTNFSGTPVSLPSPLPRSVPAWFSIAILIDNRDRVADGLRMSGVETRSLYPIPTYRQPIPEYPRDVREYPNAERASSHVLNLPLFHDLSDAEVDEVTELVLGLIDS